MRTTDADVLHVWRRAASLRAAKRARRPDGAILGAIGKKHPRPCFSRQSTSQRNQRVSDRETGIFRNSPGFPARKFQTSLSNLRTLFERLLVPMDHPYKFSTMCISFVVKVG